MSRFPGSRIKLYSSSIFFFYKEGIFKIGKKLRSLMLVAFPFKFLKFQFLSFNRDICIFVILLENNTISSDFSVNGIHLERANLRNQTLKT